MSVITNMLKNGIMQIHLQRPDQLNALNKATLLQLSNILHQVQKDASVRGVLLSGEGKGFCAGADIKELGQLDGLSGLAFARFGQMVFNQLEKLGKPSVAAIQGFALGGGCELAMAATMRIATSNAVFGQPEIKLGIIPGFGGTQRLPRLIGRGRALELCLTGRRFSGDEAFQWGLVNELSPAENLMKRATELLQEITQLSPQALSSIITAIHQGSDMTLQDGLELEAAQFALCCTTKDKKEGVSAFLEKRQAVFSGN